VDRRAKLARAGVAAYQRASIDRVEVGRNVHSVVTNEKLRMATKPPRLSSSMRKSGAALLLAPDPVTAIPGVALLAASVAMKKRDPASLEDLAKETRKMMRDLGSLL